MRLSLYRKLLNELIKKLLRHKTKILNQKRLCLAFSYLLMGKVHGSLAQAGKVRQNTPKVPKMEKKKPLRGRAATRKHYNKYFLSVNPDAKRKLGPNSHSQ